MSSKTRLWLDEIEYECGPLNRMQTISHQRTIREMEYIIPISGIEAATKLLKGEVDQVSFKYEDDMESIDEDVKLHNVEWEFEAKIEGEAQIPKKVTRPMKGFLKITKYETVGEEQ